MDNEAPSKLLEDKKQPLDLFIVIFLALLAVTCALLLPDGNALRVIMSIPLLILLPGYAMVSALWPENNDEGKSIDMLGRVALSIGLSIVIMSVMGLLLSFTVGLTVTTVLAGNLTILIAWAGIAFFQRVRLPSAKQFSPVSFRRPSTLFSSCSEMVMAALIVAGIVICSGFVAYAMFIPANTETYSELYILDANQTTQNYPVNIIVNGTAVVILGIANHEQSAIDYTIQFDCENSTIPMYVNDWNNTYAITNTTSLARNITLTDNTDFEDAFSFYFPEPGEYKVLWRLLIDGQATDYEVHLWIKVNP